MSGRSLDCGCYTPLRLSIRGPRRSFAPSFQNQPLQDMPTPTTAYLFIPISSSDTFEAVALPPPTLTLQDFPSQAGSPTSKAAVTNPGPVETQDPRALLMDPAFGHLLSNENPNMTQIVPLLAAFEPDRIGFYLSQPPSQPERSRIGGFSKVTNAAMNLLQYNC